MVGVGSLGVGGWGMIFLFVVLIVFIILGVIFWVLLCNIFVGDFYVVGGKISVI